MPHTRGAVSTAGGGQRNRGGKGRYLLPKAVNRTGVAKRISNTPAQRKQRNPEKMHNIQTRFWLWNCLKTHLELALLFHPVGSFTTRILFPRSNSSFPTPSWPDPPHCIGFTIILRHTALGRTPLQDWSARRRELYVTTNNARNRQRSVLQAGFEPVSDRPQTHALDSAAMFLIYPPLILSRPVMPFGIILLILSFICYNFWAGKG
jgi:hypothetical protein